MDPNFEPLDTYLATNELDAYLIRANGNDPDQRYLSGFGSVDPFSSLYTPGEIHLLVRGLDRALAREQSRASTVRGGTDYDRSTLEEQYGPEAVDARVLEQFLIDHEVSAVGVPPSFPIGLADELRECGMRVHVERTGVIESIRAVKQDSELAAIEQTQRATERAMRHAIELLASASINGEILTHKTAPLTSERVKNAIEVSLLKDGCVTDETIVAGGSDAAQPHERGSGPLPAHEPIVIDVFPRDRNTRYYADMTRTVCVGDPSERAGEWYELTKRAQQEAFAIIEPGVTGEAVHHAVCSVYEEAGVPTERSDPGTETGFVHGTGHGVGLAVHEEPRLSSGGDILQPGHVVTVEPGAYDPAVGGIRLEDMVVVTEDGFDRITEFETQFVL